VATGVTESAADGLALLRLLSSSLADAVTTDDVARATLTAVLGLPGVSRAGMALSSGGGRQLRFLSTDDESLTPTRVRWCLIDAFADVPLVDAVRTGTDVYLASPVELAAAYPGVAVRQRALGTRSLVALALATESERVGGLLLCFGEDQDFDVEQRWVLSALSAQVTQALRRGLAYQRQHSTAEQLQRSLMPRSLPDLDGLRLGSHYRSGALNTEVGGDWYDVVPLPDGSTAIAVGDVMGKGTGAALLMSEMRAAVRAYALLDPAPSVVLARMDALVAAETLSEQLVTLAYGLVSADRGVLRLALAGHPPPVLVAPGRPAEVLGERSGSVLGVGAGPWPETRVDLGGGRTVLLYSDGLVESRHRDLFVGIAELAGHVDDIPVRRRQPRELCARLAQLMTDDHTDDDVTLLAVAVSASEAVSRASVRLPNDTTAPTRARRFLREVLSTWHVEEGVVEAAELCVSELVTNAVIHTATSSELTAELGEERLTVLVRDGGSSGTVHRSSDQEDPLLVSGRGLTLVDAVASAWAAEHGADGTTVWFELDRGAG
jgi:serine phosphatase RsbU (regulator of sigma subunit)/anti-sigma regulatory factor (Ser/Thr protein kinase)